MSTNHNPFEGKEEQERYRTEILFLRYTYKDAFSLFFACCCLFPSFQSFFPSFVFRFVLFFTLPLSLSLSPPPPPPPPSVLCVCVPFSLSRSLSMFTDIICIFYCYLVTATDYYKEWFKHNFITHATEYYKEWFKHNFITHATEYFAE